MKLKTLRIGYDSFAWILETLRDLAPFDVADNMIERGLVQRRDADDPGAATWSMNHQRTDPHENMGSAVEGIVDELTDLEGELEAAMTEAQLIELERIAAMMYDLLGTNLDADTLGFTADDVLVMFNKYAAGKYPNGHRELY